MDIRNAEVQLDMAIKTHDSIASRKILDEVGACAWPEVTKAIQSHNPSIRFADKRDGTIETLSMFEVSSDSRVSFGYPANVTAVVPIAEASDAVCKNK